MKYLLLIIGLIVLPVQAEIAGSFSGAKKMQKEVFTMIEGSPFTVAALTQRAK